MGHIFLRLAELELACFEWVRAHTHIHTLCLLGGGIWVTASGCCLLGGGLQVRIGVWVRVWISVWIRVWIKIWIKVCNKLCWTTEYVSASKCRIGCCSQIGDLKSAENDLNCKFNLSQMPFKIKGAKRRFRRERTANWSIRIWIFEQIFGIVSECVRTLSGWSCSKQTSEMPKWVSAYSAISVPVQRTESAFDCELHLLRA